MPRDDDGMMPRDDGGMMQLGAPEGG